MLLNSNIQQEINLLCKRCSIKRLELFGSAISGDVKDSHDLDFLIEFDANANINRFDNYFILKSQLELLFNKSVDLVIKSAIKNPYFKDTISKTQLIYEQ
jgi:hypothetical protein